MKSRLSEDAVAPMTVVNPPPVQEMDSGRNGHDGATSSAPPKDDKASASPKSDKDKDNDGVQMEMVPL